MSAEGLWCAVLERAFLDACGLLTGLSGHTSPMARYAMVKEAQEFLLTNDWIYDVTGVPKECVMKKRILWKQL